MPLFPIDDAPNQHTIKAREILHHANNIAEQLRSLFLSSYDALWSVPGYTVEDAQGVLDAMDALSPGSAVASFQMHGAFGTFLNTVFPGAVPEEFLASPVAYEVEMVEGVPHILLKGETYPTEVV